jgi:tetratricopeptide (TPR) repeat protein
MRKAKFQPLSLSVLLIISLVTSSPAAPRNQDQLGGASLIFIARPNNPPVHKRAAKAQVKSPGSSPVKPETKPQTEKHDAVSAPDMSDEVEDALALGNSARDAEPPRYQDAEKAYWLAAKLDSQDPRPYLGLANLWYDQKNYQAAAKMYREATDRMEPKKSSLGIGKMLGGLSSKATVGDNQNRSTVAKSAEAHAYAGSALLQAGLFTEAEAQLRLATNQGSTNGQSFAMLGYGLFQQKKYAEATEALKRAVALSPDNDAYKKLLAESETRQQQ